MHTCMYVKFDQKYTMSFESCEHFHLLLMDGRTDGRTLIVVSADLKGRAIIQ